MIIHANVTIPKSMGARSGSNVAAVQIVHRDLQAHRDRWARGVQLVLRAFPGSEARLGLRVPKA